MFFEGYGYHGTSFKQTYRCYPASFIDKFHLTASLHIDYPMLFELRNAATERISHCGVLEFIAEEGMIYMPYWMMENLLLQEGDTVQVKNVTLRRGTYVKLQPHTKDFLDISNPKAILETTLRNFSCLTTGDSIMTDCEVDFAPPLDYKGSARPAPSVPSNKTPGQVQEAPAEVEPRFSPFTGFARRLDGKPLKHQTPPVSFSQTKDKQAGEANGRGQNLACPTSQSTTPRQPQGKLVAAKEIKQEQSQKKQEPKFQAFTGRKYSLKVEVKEEARMAMMQWCGAIARRVTMSERVGTKTPSLPALCGRGDKRTKKGKRFKGSFGNARPKKEKKIERIKDKVEVDRSTPWPLPFKLI
ncbi:Ubiquitin fusion degradation protein UFD1 [Macleaya cordata]|uniref:Ubiquitin fusion degradation protein UFD1 n=1 Tax=Macleaya cordata TaxID=56857 RepID=A0A200RCH8_MACCD|nr:Ubiquitin fusion degradation protein UFD1 [Macleaya cordata]